MTCSWQEVPHAWVTQKVDITLLEQHRQTVKHQFKSRSAPLTMTAIMVKVVAKALAEFPKFKAMFELNCESNFQMEMYTEPSNGMLNWLLK